ncbi:MAG: recombination protein RecR [Nitrospinae bacterium]|nr:recombination protein RecR [Nitrospinota bacterium]
MYRPKSVSTLIEELVKLPGIGQKTAERLAFYILKASKDEAERLAMAILDLKGMIRQCSICHNITDHDPCEICTNHRRDKSTLCVVEEPHDLYAIEKTGGYKGCYHVLMGVISPLEGIGPDDLTISGLMNRIERDSIKEVIIATNPNMEGDATAMYISKLIKPLQVKATRIARGLPMGGDLEYADEVTLMKSFEGRMEI